ncbi:MAG: hypothetical protein KDK08_12360, partial [Rhizobiaceae bacterium]|nr:hypothetical protein [Rhizobiaceae bacterium]
VAAQLRLAIAPEAVPLLVQDDIGATGAAMEARIYAENPDKRFLPSPGQISGLDMPELPGVRYDAGYVAGNEVTVHYDPLVMKVIASGNSRDEARARLVAALRAMRIDGLTTNVAFLISLLERVDVVTCDFDTGTIERPVAA